LEDESVVITEDLSGDCAVISFEKICDQFIVTLSDGGQAISGMVYNVLGETSGQLAINIESPDAHAFCRNHNFEIPYSCELPSVMMPNAFSPNDDGMNDTFGPISEEAIGWTFGVYDRWGKELFFTDQLEGKWNGRVKAEDADIGLYVYYVIAEFPDGRKQTVRGNVTLVR